MKVYCNDCAYLKKEREPDPFGHMSYWCKLAESYMVEGNFFKVKNKIKQNIKYEMSYENNNNCPDYKRKWWKFWLKVYK